MSDLHQEHHLEAEICACLSAHGWLYAEGDAARFDRARGLFLPDMLAWLVATQAQSWQRLATTHGAALPSVLAERVRRSLDERGAGPAVRGPARQVRDRASGTLKAAVERAMGIEPTS